MEFKGLLGYKTAWSLAGPIIIACIVGSFAFAVFVVVYFDRKQKEQSSQVMGIDTYGNIYSLSMKNYSLKDREIEMDAHVRDCYEICFNYDEGTYLQNMKDASFVLTSDSYKRLRTENQQKDLYTSIRTQDLRFTTEIINLTLDISNKKGSCSAIQTISAPMSSIKRNLNTEFTFVDVNRVRGKNPHGLKLNIRVTDDSPIQSKAEHTE